MQTPERPSENTQRARGREGGREDGIRFRKRCRGDNKEKQRPRIETNHIEHIGGGGGGDWGVNQEQKTDEDRLSETYSKSSTSNTANVFSKTDTNENVCNKTSYLHRL